MIFRAVSSNSVASSLASCSRANSRNRSYCFGSSGLRLRVFGGAARVAEGLVMAAMIPGHLAAGEGLGECRQNCGCSAPTKILRIAARPIYVNQLHLADLDHLRGTEKLRGIPQSQGRRHSLEYAGEVKEAVRLIHRISSCAKAFCSLAFFQKFVARESASRLRDGEGGCDG